MATLARVTLTPVGAAFQGTAAGQAAGYQAASGGGDLIPISSGRGTIIRFKTTGTGSTITLDSVVASSYGTDVNPQIVMAATDEQEVFIPNDGSLRFDQQPTNPGLLAISYSSVVGLSVAAKTVP